MTAPATERLTARLEAALPQLVERTVAEMYRNPFWEARFGARGRRHSEEDGRFHVIYLADALRWSAPRILENYATWLRTVLVSRGMCTLHLDEHLARLTNAVAVAAPDEAPLAAEYVASARAALRYAGGPERAVQDAAAEAAAHARGALKRRTRSDAGAPDDPEYLVAYLADSLAGPTTDALAGYVRWLDAGWFAARGGRPALLHLLAAVRGGLAAAGGPHDAIARWDEAAGGVA